MKIKAFLDSFNKIILDEGISEEKLIDIFTSSLLKTYAKENPEVKVEVKIDLGKELIRMYEQRVVVPDEKKDIDEDKEIPLQEALLIKKNHNVGDICLTKVNIEDFSLRMVNYFSQLIRHNINEFANNQTYLKWADKKGMILKAEVEKVDSNAIIVNLGNTKGVLPHDQKIMHEKLIPGQSYLFLVKDVKQKTKSWPVVLSRNDDAIFRYIIGNEVTEINNGLIEIVKIARIPGIKAKIALKSHQYGLDPVTQVIGYKGERIKKISSLLNGEKIDVFLYDEDPKQFLVNAVYPCKIYGLEMSDDEDKPGSKIVTMIIEDKDDLAKVIGRKADNIKLLDKLTNWSIDAISLDMAIEDQVQFENISHMSSSKTKTRRYYGSKSNSYDGQFDLEKTNQDDLYQMAINNITDQDVDDLLTKYGANTTNVKSPNVIYTSVAEQQAELAEKAKAAEPFNDSTVSDSATTDAPSTPAYLQNKGIDLVDDVLSMVNSQLPSKNKKPAETTTTVVQPPITPKPVVKATPKVETPLPTDDQNEEEGDLFQQQLDELADYFDNDD